MEVGGPGVRGAGGSFCVTGMGGWTGKGGDGGVFGKANTEVPLPPCGGQGQVMRTRERAGSRGMACALGSPGVQGSSVVTLNQNRRLPFERLEGRRTGGQINTKVGSGVLHGLGARQNSLTPVPTVVCVCVCVSVFQSENARGCVSAFTTSASCYFCDLPPSYLFVSTPCLTLFFVNNLFFAPVSLSVGPSAFPFASSCPPSSAWQPRGKSGFMTWEMRQD